MSEIESLLKCLDIRRAATGGSDNSKPSMILRENERLEDLEKYLPAPMLTKRTVHHSDWESFLDYLDEWQHEESRVYIGEDVIKLIVDHPDVDHTSWEFHTSEFPLKYSPQFEMWAKHVTEEGCSVSQVAFALLLDRRAADIVNPSCTEMLEIASTLEAKKNVDWKTGTRLKDGTVQFMFEETISAKAGQKGQLDIPDTFSISLPMYKGAEPVLMEIKLRYRLEGPKITFLLEWADLEAAKDKTLAKLKADIEAKGCKAFLGYVK